MPQAPIPVLTTAEGATDSAARPISGLATVETALLQSLSRAASQGLLDPAEASEETTPTHPEAEHDAAVDSQEGNPAILPDLGTGTAIPEDRATIAFMEDSPSVPFAMSGPADNPMQKAEEAAPPDLAAMLSDLPGITAQTSVDRDRRYPTQAADLSQGEEHCTPDAELDIASWGDDRDFATQIAERHSALVGEFDRMSATAVEDLARSYLYFGFGREAKQALLLDGRRSKPRNVLLALAAIVDAEDDPQHLFDDQLDCESAAALWALLSRRGRTDGSPVATLLVQRSYRNLPPSLLGHLGQSLAAALLEMGDADAAESVLDRSSTATTATTTANGLTTAEVAMNRGNAEDALATLTSLAEDDARLTPEALLRLFAIADETGAPIEDDLLALSQALRFQFRHTPVATELAKAETRALLYRDEFDTALALVQADESDLDAAARVALEAEIAAGIVARTDDIAFLRHAIAGLPASSTAETENAAAARLIALGFPDRAATLLIGDAQFAAAAERRYLRAEAAIALGAPRDALAILQGFSDDRAALLRSAAQAALGDYGAAMTAQPLVPGEAATDAAWRAGAWARLAGSEDTLMRRVAESMLAVPATDGPAMSPPTIAEGADLLVSAEQTRTLVGDLLARFPAGEAERPADR
jgi:hypothetical protein